MLAFVPDSNRSTMKVITPSARIVGWRLTFCLALAGVLSCSPAADRPTPLALNTPTNIASTASAALVPLILKLPDAAFKGTPPELKVEPNVEPYSDKDRPPMLVPAGLKNIALGAKLTASDTNAAPESLIKITDGDKEAGEQSVIYFRKGTQWAQMDFGSPQEIFAIVIWHAHNTAKVYHDVIVQAADNADFTQGVKTLFNNDQDNSSKLGVGTDREYFETRQGKLINANGTRARFLRFYSKGSTESALNEYTEIEVYGRPAK